MNADGSNQRRIASGGSGLLINPVWTLDSQRLFFGNTAEGMEFINVDGSKRTALHPGKAHNPSLSPDGQQLVYAVDDGGNYNLYTIKSSGGNPNFLTAAPSSEIEPVWSPDGQRIAFISAPSTDTERGELYLINADGSNPVQLVTGLNSHPAWSPDGRQIAFTKFEGNDEIYVMNAEPMILIQPGRRVRRRHIIRDY